MADVGLCVNARNARPDGRELAALGLSKGWVRSIVYDFDSYEALLDNSDPRTHHCALLNSEAAGVGSDYAGWDDTIDRFCARFHRR